MVSDYLVKKNNDFMPFTIKQYRRSILGWVGMLSKPSLFIINYVYLKIKKETINLLNFPSHDPQARYPDRQYSAGSGKI